LLKSKYIKESLAILLTALILGSVTNILHPKRIHFSFKRPPLEYAPDTVAAQDLPIANISFGENQTDQSEPLVVDTKYLSQLIAQNNVVLIDARSKSEFLKEHLPQAINIPYEHISEYTGLIKTLPHDKWLICYCEGPPCDLGEVLAIELCQAGFEKTGYYYGGLTAWKYFNRSIDKSVAIPLNIV